MPRRFSLKSRSTLWLLVALGVLAAVLFAPTETTSYVRTASSYDTGPGGASGFFEVAARLGWPVERRNKPSVDVGNAVFISLSPHPQLTATEVHRILDEVRAGAGFIGTSDLQSGASFGPKASTPLADSLGVAHSEYSMELPLPRRDSACSPSLRERLQYLGAPSLMRPLIVAHPSPLADSGFEQFIALDRPAARAQRNYAGARGIRFGKGRIVIITESGPLENDVLRQCFIDVSAPDVRMLEFVSGGNRPKLVFDEYRHGHGQETHLFASATSVFTGTPSGRGLIQLLAAGVILLVGIAPRALPPRATVTIERRSPFEHVAALAAAYSRAGATRLATRRLVRGLRRRMPGAVISTHSESDEQFLDSLLATHPEFSADVARIKSALSFRIKKDELLAVEESIENIERSLRA